MARIPGLPAEDAPPEIRRVYDLAARTYGKQLEPLAVTAHNPEIFRAYAAFEGSFAAARRLDRRLKELVTLKAAALIGCPFCLDIGSAQARAAGLGDRELRALAAYRESDAFSPLEKAALDYATAMTASRVTVDDALVATLREHLDPAALVELTATIAWENYRSRFNHALGIEAQGFSEGTYCVLPEA